MRNQFGNYRDLPLMSLLTILVGILTSLIVITFRFLIVNIRDFILGSQGFANANLSNWQLFVIPFVGVIGVAVVGHYLKVDGRQVGIVHVMHRRNFANSTMPYRNSLMQFIGGSIALSTGSPGGWLGPSIHLGASTAALVYGRFTLPPDAVLTLLAAGIAAAITACIDTPIAGILFAAEVVLLRFTLKSFVPVILAAGVSSVMIRLLGFGPLIEFPELHIAMVSLTEFALILPAGIAIGLIAACFNYSIEIASGIQMRNFSIRCLVVGIVIGLVAYIWPHLLGTGFELIRFDLSYWNSWTILGLLGFVLLKLTLVSLSVGFGMPVGIVSPCLVAGALFGVIMYKIAMFAMPMAETSDLAFYMLLGSCAMFAAVLNAPLTALVCVLELCGMPQIMFSAMLLIAVADLTAAPLYGRKSVFEARLRVINESDSLSFKVRK